MEMPERKSILLSIYRQHMVSFIKRKKTHEFRNYIPKYWNGKAYIYVPKPEGKLMYLAVFGSPIKFPDKIPPKNEANILFNKGQKTKYAYPLERLYLLNKTLSLDELKERGIAPPQRFSYLNPEIEPPIIENGLIEVIS